VTLTQKEDNMKKYWLIIKETAKDWVVDNWKSDLIFDKGKVIFVGIVAFFVLVKIIYSIFS
jgi:hypothetical protein